VDIEHLATDQGVAGSNPVRGSTKGKNLKHLILTIVLILSVCFSTSAIAAEWNTKTAALAMQDKAFQLEQQKQICQSGYKDAKKIRDCFVESAQAYKAFLEYMYSDSADHDELFDMCLEGALEEFWIPQKNTTDWFLVMGGAIMCYQEFAE
jgi:hypothetical protein